MSNWRKNKELAKTPEDTNSLTDQSQAHETDINVIVAKMGITGTVPGNPQQPLYGDWTQFPRDLREYIETARTIDSLQEKLPPQLKGKSYEEILSFTPQEMADLLKPADPPVSTPPPAAKE